MEEQFVTYELALKLKELGFDEKCFGDYYTKDKGLYLKGELNEGNPEYKIKAPIWQQAFDWFRDIHYLHSCIDRSYDFMYEEYSFMYCISIKGKNTNYSIWHKSFEIQRQACLEKLIEIIEK